MKTRRCASANKRKEWVCELFPPTICYIFTYLGHSLGGQGTVKEIGQGAVGTLVKEALLSSNHHRRARNQYRLGAADQHVQPNHLQQVHLTACSLDPFRMPNRIPEQHVQIYSLDAMLI